MSASTAVEASIVGWKNVGSGPQWVPALNTTEQTLGIPADLLARMAFEESSFRESVIRGTEASSAGALGMMQLMPQYFPSVDVLKPFTDQDVWNQITAAGEQLSSLYASTNSWTLAVAAYNAGLGNVQKYGGIPPFAETQKYVADISADIPAIVNA